MWIGNVMLLVINLPMIGMWVKLLQVPYRFLFPAILVFCCDRRLQREQQRLRRLFDGAVRRLRLHAASSSSCEPAPLLLGFVLGPLMEEYLRRAMLLSRGDLTVFFDRPISASMLAIAAIALLAMLLPNLRKGKDTALSG